MNTINFTCPKCGEHRLEEVMTGVVVASTIIDAKEGSIEYGEQTNEDGEVQNYQCMDCGWVVAIDQGVIRDCEELCEWLEAQEEQRRRDEKNGLYPEKADDAN